MKSKLVILGCVLALSYFQLLARDTDSILSARIERGDNLSSWSINLIIENIMQEDTLFTRSSFFIDEYRAPSRILIQHSRPTNSADSLIFTWGASHGDFEPNIISFSDERIMKIPPREKITLSVPISHFYMGRIIFLDIRMMCRVNEEVFFVEKRTNKILFEREHSEHELYQMRRRQERMEAAQIDNVEKETDYENDYKK